MSQVGQTSRTHHPLTRWAAIILLLALGASGVNDATHSMKSAVNTGQKAVIACQFGYSVLGLIATWGLLTGRRWARPALWIWAVLLALVGGLASVYWGESGPVVGLVAGVASGGIAGLVVWLALRETEKTER